MLRHDGKRKVAIGCAMSNRQTVHASIVIVPIRNWNSALVCFGSSTYASCWIQCLQFVNKPICAYLKVVYLYLCLYQCVRKHSWRYAHVWTDGCTCVCVRESARECARGFKMQQRESERYRARERARARERERGEGEQSERYRCGWKQQEYF